MTQTLSDTVATNLETVKSDSGVRRTRLREFQAQLVERMQVAQRGGYTKISQLGVMIGQTRYLVDLRESGEIVGATAVTKVPLTKDWYIGLSNIRGNLTSVVDLPRFQGQESTKLDSSCRIVAFAPGLAFNSGLLVSQVLGLRDVAEMTEVHAMVNEHTIEHPGWLQKTYQDRDGNVWHSLSLASLVQDQNFLQIGL
ncbi:chemotaxis protein CheW [Undibacterium sp. SXout7W]|uniref:chemotaxis protein CheW n=1 Tax=Undibacterium sp. SXout7W TaxID=3413049 RepID=UPI003BF40AD4